MDKSTFVSSRETSSPPFFVIVPLRPSWPVQYIASYYNSQSLSAHSWGGQYFLLALLFSFGNSFHRSWSRLLVMYCTKLNQFSQWIGNLFISKLCYSVSKAARRLVWVCTLTTVGVWCTNIGFSPKNGCQHTPETGTTKETQEHRILTLGHKDYCNVWICCILTDVATFVVSLDFLKVKWFELIHYINKQVNAHHFGFEL